MKIIAISAATLLASSPAFAGQFVNVEANSSFQDGDYSSTRFDTQYGWQDSLGDKSKYYVQGGPSFVSRDEGDTGYQFGGKVSIKTEVTEDLTAYGELKGYTGDEYDFSDIKLAVKAGLKYTF